MRLAVICKPEDNPRWVLPVSHCLARLVTGQSHVKARSAMNKTKTALGAVREVFQNRAKPRVRDRILNTARDLFYRHGTRAVGVDAIACEAGTNKMSFYRSFASKDELVAEYLRGQERESWAWWDEVVSAHEGDARAQVDALWPVLTDAVLPDGPTARGAVTS